MLTKVQTIETEISAAEKLSLNAQDVFDSFNNALQSGDKERATKYASVLMLKAMSM